MRRFRRESPIQRPPRHGVGHGLTPRLTRDERLDARDEDGGDGDADHVADEQGAPATHGGDGGDAKKSAHRAGGAAEVHHLGRVDASARKIRSRRLRSTCVL